MVSAFVIPFRETLEAALIVGVILAYLKKTNAMHLARGVYVGVGLAVFASILTAFAFTAFAGGFAGVAEEIFEGVTMLLAAGVLTYVVYWMAVQTRFTQNIQAKVDKHVSSSNALGLGLMAFTAVYREGVETVLFFNASLFAVGSESNLSLAIAGIVTAILVGYLVFKTALRFKLKTIFNATSVLLVLFAAGLTAHGVHEFQEAGVLPTPYGKVWNTNWLLDENSFAGSFAKALFGYNADPFELEVIAYFGYFALIALIYFTWFKKKVEKNALAASRV